MAVVVVVMAVVVVMLFCFVCDAWTPGSVCDALGYTLDMPTPQSPCQRHVDAKAGSTEEVGQ